MSRKHFNHVESKVSKYIKEVKEQDEIARQQHLEAKLRPNRGRRWMVTSDNEGNEETENNSDSSDSVYNALLKKHQATLQEVEELRAENKFLAKTIKEFNRAGLSDMNRITLINDSDFEQTYASSVCSADLAATQQSGNMSMCVRSGVPLILEPGGSNSAHFKKCDGEGRGTFLSVCSTTTKKILRKFSCGENNSNDNAGNELNNMQRVHTPKVLNDFAKGVNNMSTPGRMPMNASARKTPGARRVAFLGDALANDRSAKARRLMTNLNEVGEFLATL